MFVVQTYVVAVADDCWSIWSDSILWPVASCCCGWCCYCCHCHCCWFDPLPDLTCFLHSNPFSLPSEGDVAMATLSTPLSEPGTVTAPSVAVVAADLVRVAGSDHGTRVCGCWMLGPERSGNDKVMHLHPLWSAGQAWFIQSFTYGTVNGGLDKDRPSIRPFLKSGC